MKGYKAFDKNLKCRDMQYEVGKEYTFGGEPIPCKQGFHFCQTVAECYDFYPMEKATRICEVEAIGDIETDDNIKYCTNRIKIIREIENPREMTNVMKSSSGYCNSGHWNSGDYNSGRGNSGHWNSGDWNSGGCNSGDHNSGCYNSGDWNYGSCSNGVFNTDKNPKIKMFDVDSEWTINDWYTCRARLIMAKCPQTCEDKQKWWDGLSKDNKQEIYNLPNFNKKKFEKCVGIKLAGG